MKQLAKNINNNNLIIIIYFYSAKSLLVLSTLQCIKYYKKYNYFTYINNSGLAKLHFDFKKVIDIIIEK